MSDVRPKSEQVALEPPIKGIFKNVGGIALIKPNTFQITVLNQQPAKMRPKRRHQRAVRIGGLVGKLVMLSTAGHPPRGRILQTADAKQCEEMLKPFWAGKSTMSQ